ncbi:MAG: flagellar filament capping protein FliD [Burkholderiaceae bacterium]
MAISSPGIGSSLPIDSIIEQLMAAESRPLTVLSTKEKSYQAKLSAYGALSSALSLFQSSVNGLTSQSKFQQLNSKTSDAAIASATVSSTAAAGTYEVEVIQRAQAQSVSAAGQVSTTGAIGSGSTTTLSFSFGTISGGTLTNGVYSGAAFEQDAQQSTGTVTINSSNNSLQGIRDAINKANIGVTATIVSDGSSAPNKLVLTSTKTGANSSMKITVDGDPVLQNLLAHDPAGTQKLVQNSAAQDALIKINGLDISSATNTLSGAVEGMTLTLGKAGTTSIEVTRDTGSIETAVNAFVKSYNELHGTLKYQTGYNATTKTGGPLIGDATARTIQTSLRNIFSMRPEGLSGELTNLSQIGVSFQKDGTLAVDSTKLKAAITNNAADIGRLFATAGTPTDSLVSYVNSSAETEAGDHAITITALATKGQIVGSAAANTTITAGVNDSLSLIIDGVSATVELAAGSYTAESLSAHLQSKINGISEFSSAAISVTVSQTGGVLTISSNRYGSASTVVLAGNGAANLLGPAPTTTNGVDVAGTIGGQAANGSGQTLTGASGTSVEGLKLTIAGGITGNRGIVSFSRGYASQLNTLISSFIGANGLISGRTDGINQSIKDIGTQREAVNRRLADTETRYRRQFAALDSMIASMNSTSSYLSQQLASLANLNAQ